MAITYTYQNALDIARQHYRNSTEQTTGPFALNMAITEMWRAYDWRDSLAPLPPFWLVPGVQDYGFPFVSVPTDFYGLREVYLVNLNVSPVPVSMRLNVVTNLEQTGAMGVPGTICYRSAESCFRIHPAPNLGMACPQWLINGTYKILAPKVTRDDAADLIPWDDVYFETFVQFLIWANLFCSGERKAALEQKAIAMQSLTESAQNDNAQLGDPVVSPTEALTIYGSYGAYGGYGGFLY